MFDEHLKRERGCLGKSYSTLAPKVSVVIATKDRAEALVEYSLKSLLIQDFNNFEVIVCDASDNDLSLEACLAYKESLNLRYFKAPKPGLTSQRNFALEKVETELVLFIDDDIELHKNAISDLVYAADNHPEADVFGYRIEGERECQDNGLMGYFNKIFDLVFYFVPLRRKQRFVSIVAINRFPQKEIAKEEQPQWISGGGLAARRQVFDQLKFSVILEKFGGYALGEDVYFSHSALQAGFNLTMIESEPIVHHAAIGGRLTSVNHQASLTFNRFVIWYDLIYPKNRLFIFPFVWSIIGDVFKALINTLLNLRLEYIVGSLKGVVATFSLKKN